MFNSFECFIGYLFFFYVIYTIFTYFLEVLFCFGKPKIAKFYLIMVHKRNENPFKTLKS
jgi:hypothetical protein